MKLRSVLLAATVLAVPVVASAQPVEGLYVGAGAGFDYLNTLNGKNLVLSQPSTGGQTGFTIPVNTANFNSNGGFVGLGSIGWGFGNGLRAEVEGNYRSNVVRLKNTTTILGTSFNSVQGGGTFLQYGVMVNGIYDFDVGMPFVTPYAGLGVGYIENKWNPGRIYTTGLFTPNIPQIGVNLTQSAKGSGAGQIILGAAWPVMPGLAFTTEFRFMGEFSQQRYAGAATVGSAPGGGLAGSSIKIQNPTNESFLIGLRYAFYTPAPPPPPAPAPAPAPVAAPTRTYLVFFDWDRYDLTARARQIIAEAADNSKKVQVTRIEVNGYTDLSGTAAYNQKLSVRRAEAVAAELVRDGVPRNIIEAKGFGESNPLVPTAQGVREPQNRRVEIILK